MTQSTRKFTSWKKIAVLALVAIYIAVNLFHIGSDDFIFSLNNFIVVPLAVGTTILSFLVWRQLKTGSLNSLLWLGLSISWAMWMIAELWWAIAGLIGQEVPYPSGADFFWLVGYIPMYLSLGGRIRSLPRNVGSKLRVGSWIISLALLILSIVLVVVPIIQDSDPSAILENVISTLYPLADTILLILVLRVLLSYQKGTYGRAWLWIAFGFLLSAIGDLVFSYASTNDLYYPAQQVNLLSTIGSDVPYNLSYLAWIVGLFLLRDLHKTYQLVETDVKKLQLVPNTHLLVFTKADDTVIDCSQNYSHVFSTNRVEGKTISEVLGLSLEDERSILSEMKAENVLKEKCFRVNTVEGQKEILISGILVFGPQNEYSGIMLLVRVFMQDDSLDNLLTEYQTGIVRSLLSKTGAKEKEMAEIKQLLADYYGVHLAALGNRAFFEGGSIFVDAFITSIQAEAKKQGWRVGIQPTSLDVSNISLSETRMALPRLFESGKKFIIDLTDEANANAVINETRSEFSDLILRNVSRYESMEGERT